MALNASKVVGNGKPRVEQPNLEPGTYPARLVQIIDFGVQAQRPYKGEAKAPVQMVSLTYELVDSFLLDEEGKEREDKPRWITEEFPLHSLKADRAKSTLRYNALDPQGAFGGDFSLCLEVPINVTIVNNKGNDGRVFDNVASIAAMRPKDAARLQPLKNEPRFFDLDNPDAEIFNGFPQWIQDKIKGNLNYKGSKLEALLEGKPAPKQEKPAVNEHEDEDPPFVPDDNDDNPY